MTHHHNFPSPRRAIWADLDTHGRAAAIKALYGLTAEAIATKLGTTRNAVLGVAHRHRMSIGGYSPPRNTAFQTGRVVAPETWAPLGPPVASPTRKQCCWPVGEASGSAQMFCGLPRTKGSYCPTHGKMAYARRPGDHPYVDMLRDKSVQPEVTIEEAVALVLPARKEKLEGAE
ncbi:GcrA family cell cycle regulator [Devosia neptuniae]|uniref:GcrA family cell cycle regulator n=1 Tax=Devosia neptuniae TaxID=191302 RepID=A0ABY6CFA5_9HYPH|nr:GcrA family cell cycle regulator [Devosia neptuniae]UXN70924.1 GcrA family cell cycle regulator [Devosia neptuniae]